MLEVLYGPVPVDLLQEDDDLGSRECINFWFVGGEDLPSVEESLFLTDLKPTCRVLLEDPPRRVKDELQVLGAELLQVSHRRRVPV